MPQIGSIGANLDLKLRQGATFGPIVGQLKNADTTPINITGYTFRAQMRKSADDSLSTGLSFTCNVVDGATGKFSFELSDEQTSTLAVDPVSMDALDSTYVWDLEMESPLGKVTALLYGKVNVFREVTKDT